MRHPRSRFQALFTPRSVAVVGASTRPDSVGRAIFANVLLHGYTGIVYPVNPKASSILAVKTYPSVLEIPDEVDLAVIVVPSGAIPAVLEECGQRAVKAAVIISAGFKELGAEGAKREQAVAAMTRQLGMPLIGPNCLGIINTDPQFSLNASFARRMPRPGNIALISQSGAIGVVALEVAEAEGIGLSKFISVGNKADVNENDLLAYLKDDPHTDVILLYLEDLTDPKGFIRLAQEIARQKPILAIKSGRTVEGAKAASSHTGALAGSDDAYDSLFAQSGVLRVESLEELFGYAMAFSTQPLPKGNRVAIVTNAGGPGIMATDACIRHGLTLAGLQEPTKSALRSGLPPAANIDNPVDILGDAGEDRYALALERVFNDETVDGVIVLSTPQLMTDLSAVASAVARIAPGHHKPTLVSLMSTGRSLEEALAILTAAHVPHYRFPEDAARALAAMARYTQSMHRPRSAVKTFTDVDRRAVTRILDGVQQEGRRFLPEPEAYDILHDPHFGPLLLFGLGGTYVEVFKDVTVRIAPITELDAHQMFQQLKSFPMLSGYRGEPPSDLEAITDCLERLSQLALDFPSIHELDINPLVVFGKGQGAGVIDARIFIS